MPTLPARLLAHAAMLDSFIAVEKDHQAELEAKAADLREAARALEWQPIEGAPKDGTAVLLYSPGRFVVGCWFFGDWAVTEPCHGDRLNDSPTHWRPLLSPPKEQT